MRQNLIKSCQVPICFSSGSQTFYDGYPILSRKICHDPYGLFTRLKISPKNKIWVCTIIITYDFINYNAYYNIGIGI